MAAANALAFPVRGQAFRLAFRIDAYSTANPVAGGLTGLACTLSKDGAAFVSSTNAPVEIGTTGYGYVDLTAAETNYTSVLVRVTATNSGAVEFGKEVCFLSDDLWDLIASGVWSYATPDEVAAAIPANMGLVLRRLFSYMGECLVKSGDVVTLKETDANGTTLATQAYSVTSEGFTRSAGYLP